MKPILLFFTAIALAGCQSAKVSRSATPSEVAEEVRTSRAGQLLMGNPRPITFQGTRSGEGYFSRDGLKMVFQSERVPGNPFYQIFLKDLETGKTQRVSNGNGKTTCAWIHPNGEKVLYASTHLDPHWKAKAKEEMETREKGGRPKYSWSYDEFYDLYESNLKTGKARALAPAKGYDAEGSYSPDGQWIAFASNRHAYSEKLSEEELKRRDEDPSYFMEIYIMKADGTGLRRLTQEVGYDGGPFFSPDGKRIVWRRFTPNGKTAEVYTMNVDGSEQKQITQLNAMSWAPYFHPSGDYIIFATNLHGYDNFELYIIDSEGKSAPQRVTNAEGFDGLPVFSPDGQRLMWTKRNQKGESQIYRIGWNDQVARQLLNLPAATVSPSVGSGRVSAVELQEWVNYLASDEMEGRLAGSKAELKYSQRIAQQFNWLGLKPMGGNEFQQAFEFESGVKLGSKNKLSFSGMDLRPITVVNRDWAPLSFSKLGATPEGEIIFVGYGIVAPANEKMEGYNSYQGLEVKGKWALALEDIPDSIPNDRRYQLNLYAKLQHKALVAAQAGAIGLLLINPNKESVALRYEGSGGQSGIPVVEISKTLANALLMPTGKGLSVWKEELDKGQLVSSDIKGVGLQSEVEVIREKSRAYNVVGRLEVPGSKETLLIGAHGDHLGRGEAGNSLAKGDEVGKIHSGADDNASGVAAVLEAAHLMTRQMRSGEFKPKYNIAFAIWSAEEQGIVGSSHFASNLGKEKVVAYINLDMVGRLREGLQVQGTGSSRDWLDYIESLSAKTGVPLLTQADPYLPTDSMAFYLKGIPAINFFTGSHSEYHTPRDQVDTINFPGLAAVTNIVADLAMEMAATGLHPQYIKVEGSRKSMEGRGFRLYLGTIPDYATDGVKGVKISGTTKSSPAEKAGLKEGDIIVQLGGVSINNIQDYVYCLQSMKANEPTPVKVMRQGRIVELTITPALKGM